jgi:hypothetical protein
VGSIRIETEKPIAYDSPDHIQPHGTANDNTTQPRFNRKLGRLIPACDVRPARDAAPARPRELLPF